VSGGQGSRKRRRRPSWRMRVRRATYVGMLVVIALLGGGFVALESVTIPERVGEVRVTSFVCTAQVPDGRCDPSNAVASFATSNRTIIPLADVSQHMIDALLATEDRGYYRHSGVDPWGIARALYRDVRGDAVRQGGSTITQQYVKLAYLSQERTLLRKVREAGIAIKLERELSKDEILERYLNEIYFGRGAYGIEAAAQTYFGVDARSLDVPQSAFLAGLVRAPNRADPAKDPDEAKRRRRTALVAMAEEGHISTAEVDRYDAIPLDGWVQPRQEGTTGTWVRGTFAVAGGKYITEWVRQQLAAMDGIGESKIYSGGLRVYLTIDPTLQNAAAAAVAEVVSAPEDPAVATMTVDERGRILAMIGGQNFDASEVNYALGRAGGGSGRPAGSTFKPLALAAFVEQGNSITSRVAAPKQIVFPEANAGEDWTVTNYEDREFGEISVEQATWNSVNTAYAQIMQQVTPQAFVQMAQRLGVQATVAPVLASVLGTADVSVLDMARAYSVFANHGTLVPPYIIRRVEDPDGNVLYDVADSAAHPELAPVPDVIPPPVADTVTSALTGVVKSGSGKAAALRQPVAGKTGTTQNYRDAWFVGYSCTATTAVWMGYPGKPGYDTPAMDPYRGVQVTGGSFPAQIFKKIMTPATQAQKGCKFEKVDAGTTVGVANPAYLPTTTTVPPAVAPAPDPAAPPTTAAPATPATTPG